jgi:periplasmic protein CpxP/Spy
MKKMLVLLAAVALSAASASAQTTETAPAARMQDTARTPEQRAERQTQRLTQQLGLSPDQTAKVQPIALAESQEMQALRGKYAATITRKGAGQEMRAVQEKYDAQLKAVFTAEQYAKYQQLRDERMDKRKEMKNSKLK